MTDLNPEPVLPRALLFDVFGTVVDWRSSIAREVQAALASHSASVDSEAFADRWRALYQPAMSRVRSGKIEFVPLDKLHIPVTNLINSLRFKSTIYNCYFVMPTYTRI